MPSTQFNVSKVCPKCGNLDALDWANLESLVATGDRVAMSTICSHCQWVITISATIPGLEVGESEVAIPHHMLKTLFQNTELHTRKCNERSARESEAIEWCQAFFGAGESSEEEDLYD